MYWSIFLTEWQTRSQQYSSIKYQGNSDSSVNYIRNKITCYSSQSVTSFQRYLHPYNIHGFWVSKCKSKSKLSILQISPGFWSSKSSIFPFYFQFWSRSFSFISGKKKVNLCLQRSLDSISPQEIVTSASFKKYKSLVLEL